MLRSRLLDRHMTRLALAAVLLLAFAPAVGRVLSAGSPRVLAGWSELCTGMGLQLLPSEARAASGKPAAPDGLPAGGDCAYCPLAASLPLLLPGLAILFPAWTRQAPLPRVAPRRRATANRRGLGSRGPPILL